MSVTLSFMVKSFLKVIKKKIKKIILSKNETFFIRLIIAARNTIDLIDFVFNHVEWNGRLKSVQKGVEKEKIGLNKALL